MIGLVFQGRRLAALELRLVRLTRGSDGGNLQDVLEAHLDTVDRAVDELDALSARSAVLESKSQRALQHLGFVRFNPFEDTGGNQSFVLALLDGGDDGVVISSLHSRSSTRVYAKSVTGGRADGALSAEESQALELAAAAQPAGTPVDGTRSPSVRSAGGSAEPRAAPAATNADLQSEGRERRRV